MNKKTNQIKSLSDSNICRNEAKTNQKTELVKQNTRTLMQAFFGCRKNCRECKEEEEEWEDELEPKIIQKEVVRE